MLCQIHNLESEYSALYLITHHTVYNTVKLVLCIWPILRYRWAQVNPRTRGPPPDLSQYLWSRALTGELTWCACSDGGVKPEYLVCNPCKRTCKLCTARPCPNKIHNQDYCAVWNKANHCTSMLPFYYDYLFSAQIVPHLDNSRLFI